MLGLAVLFFIALYFFCLIFFTRLAHKLAILIGASKKVASLCSLLVFSAIFLPVFWDIIPNKIMYKHYCENEAGFFQYKTIEQWKAENPGVWETLRPYSEDEVGVMREKKTKPPNMMYEGNEYYSTPANSRITVYTSVEGAKDMGFKIRRTIKFW